MPSKLNRRRWITAATSTLALSAASYRRVWGAGERLRVGSVGTGGQGWSDLRSVAASPAVQVTALCNIDHSSNHLGQAAERFPDAAIFSDWRKLLDSDKSFDAVIVSTPDFMHAPISLAAMHLGKHVFCEKPLTHTVFEARQMRLAANRFGCVTQMGNQIQSHSAYRTAVQIVHDGWIGKVLSVHSWQAGKPSWPRNIDRPPGADPVPDHIDWELWTGVAPQRPYKAGLYHPFNWRGWRDFGTGQLGDFGCHILDPVFKSLGLTAPLQLQAEAPAIKSDTWTEWAKVHYQFPGTARTEGERLNLHWYDGVDLLPPRAALGALPADAPLPASGSVLVGQTGTLLIPHVAAPKLYPEEKFAANGPATVDGVDHYVQWADACRGAATTTSAFDYAGPLTEAVLLGTVAVRLPGQQLQWDAENLRVTNLAEAQAMITKSYRQGWQPVWL